MSRVQLALNVTNLDAAIEFYSKLFATEPAKLRPGYANFAVENPPLKLILFQGDGAGGTINHLGVEVESTEQVNEATVRLTGQGLDTLTEDEVACCYALQDKVWVTDPDGAKWEVYTVLDHVEMDTLGCGLDDAAREERAGDIQSLLAPVLQSVERSDNGVRLVMSDRPGLVDEVRALVAKEQQCCSFLSFDVADDAGRIVLDITGPAEAKETLDAFVSLGAAAVTTAGTGCC